MQKLDIADVLQQMLRELNDLPEGFEQKLVDLATSNSTTRAARIRVLIEKVTRG